jgi:hypothetical protein
MYKLTFYSLKASVMRDCQFASRLVRQVFIKNWSLLFSLFSLLSWIIHTKVWPFITGQIKITNSSWIICVEGVKTRLPPLDLCQGTCRCLGYKRTHVCIKHLWVSVYINFPRGLLKLPVLLDGVVNYGRVFSRTKIQ